MPSQKHTTNIDGPRPITSDQIGPDDRLELSDGRPIYCAPTAWRGGASTLDGGIVLSTDPGAADAAVDPGFSPRPDLLRAPDLAVGNIPREPGWVEGVPPLAVEYADTGQDEAQLKKKIDELLAEGTQVFWVVRLTGPRRVEVHEKGKPMRLVVEPEELTAPGILANPVPVRALYDQETAHEVALRNLLNRKGYESLEAVRQQGAESGRAEGELKGRAEGELKGRAEGELKGRAEGEHKGKAEALVTVLRARGLALSKQQEETLLACRDSSLLDRWIVLAATASSIQELFE